MEEQRRAAGVGTVHPRPDASGTGARDRLCHTENRTNQGSDITPMEAPDTHQPIYRFAGHSLDVELCTVFSEGEPLRLRPQSFDVLRHLLERAGRPVSSRELLDSVWSDRVVTADSVRKCIGDLREALGDSDATIIRTVPRRGYLLDVPVERVTAGSDEIVTAPIGRARRIATSLAFILVLLAGGLFALNAAHQPVSPTLPGTDGLSPASIAVLRFADLSPGGNQAYLADGIAEEILHVLTQSPELRVIARTSSFAVQGQSVGAVVEQLNVDFVLEGSVRRDAGRIRVAAQLIDAKTDSRAWSKVYERQIEDLFEVQAEIAGAVAQSLDVSLGLTSRASKHPEAQAQFLMGRYYYLRRGKGDLERAREHYERAVAIDPAHARAWVGLAALAFVVRIRSDELGMPYDARWNRAEIDVLHRRAIEQALIYGADLPETQRRAATFFFYVEGDLERARRHNELALSLDPEHWLVRSMIASAHEAAGRPDEAVAILRHDMRQDPLNLLLRRNLGHYLLRAGRIEEAVDEFARVHEIEADLTEQTADSYITGQVLLGRLAEADDLLAQMADSPARLKALALVRYAQGRIADANEALRLLKASAAGSLTELHIAEIYAFRGDIDAAIAWLGRVVIAPGCAGASASEVLYYSPLLARLAGHPEWSARRTAAGRQIKVCGERYYPDSGSLPLADRVDSTGHRPPDGTWHAAQTRRSR